MWNLNKLVILVTVALCAQEFPAWAFKSPYLVTFAGRTTWSKEECIEKAQKGISFSQGWVPATRYLNTSISVAGEKLVGKKRDAASTVQILCDYPRAAFFVLATTGDIKEANKDLKNIIQALGCDVESRLCRE